MHVDYLPVHTYYNNFCLEHVIQPYGKQIELPVGEGSVTSKAIPNVHILFIMIFMEAGLIIHCVWLDLKCSYGHCLNAYASSEGSGESVYIRCSTL